MSFFIDLFLNNIVTIFIFIITVWLFRQHQQRRRLPPGPWPWPVIGNLMLLLRGDRRHVFRKLRKQYGDLVSLRVGSQNILVVNGVDMLYDVFINHGKYFDKRPQVFTVLKVGQGKAVLNASGKSWKEHRKFLLEHMNNLGIGKTQFESNVQDEIEPFLQILESTKGDDFDPRVCIETAMSNIICSISFGKRFEYDNPDFIEMLDIFEANMKVAGTGMSLVNYFPFLAHLPGDHFKCRQVLENVAKVQMKLSAWIENHRSTFDPENPRDFIDYYLLEMKRKLERKKETTMDDGQLLKFVGDLFVAGTETTSTSIRWALIFLVRNPDIQKKVYQEVMETLGSRKQLSILDKSEMPYTHAVILECQRLADIAPFSFPRSNFEPVQLGEFIIPANTLVIPNINSVHMDSQVWEEPMEFRPSRFLDETGKVVSKKEFMPFFIGARTCPGARLAKMELFLFITSIVQNFEIVPSKSKGMPTLDGHIGVTYLPHPHKLRFIRRNDNSGAG